MKRVQILRAVSGVFAVLFCVALGSHPVSAQSVNDANAPKSSSNAARPVILPLTIRVKGEVVANESELQTVDLTVNEDGDPQTILSIRARVTGSPINLMLLIQ